MADRKRRISLIGGRFTASLALQFYLHLRELRPRVQLVSGQTATWVEHLLDIGRKDVLVVYDPSGHEIKRMENVSSAAQVTKVVDSIL